MWTEAQTVRAAQGQVTRMMLVECRGRKMPLALCHAATIMAVDDSKPRF